MTADYQFVSGHEACDWNFIVPTIQATWFGQGRSRDAIIQAAHGSVCYGVKSRVLRRQIGFCRVLTDTITYAWIADVIVAKELRRRGVGSFMLTSLMADGRFSKSVVFHLHTADMQAFYRKLGFVSGETMWTPQKG